MLDTDVADEKVCKTKPSRIKKSATYVVDVSGLDSMEDIKKDEFGVWNYSGSHPKAYKVNEDMSLVNVSTSAKGSNVVLLRRLHCTHPSNPAFKRLICSLSG